MKSIGIDIGTLSVKVVELESQANRGYRFGGAKIYPLKPDLADQEIQLLQILKKITEDFDLTEAKVITSISQKLISMRKVFFPFKERQKILKSLAFEIEDDIPYSLEKAVCESKVLSLHDNATEVMALTTPKSNVANRLQFLAQAGIDPEILSCSYGALTNLYNQKWYKSPTDEENSSNGIRLGVAIGHRSTFTGLVQGQRLIWGREISWGAEAIALNISKTFAIPFSETIKMMPEKAFLLVGPTDAGTSQEQTKMSDCIKQALDPLIQALRITQLSAQTDFEVTVDTVEIFGGASEIKNLGPFLTQSLELPVNLKNPLDDWGAGPVDSLRPHKQACAMALGLALEGLKKPLNPAVNFRQGEFVKKNKSFEKFWDKWNYTIKLVAIAWFCYLAAGITRNQIASQLDDTSYELARDKTKKIAKISKFTSSKAKKFIKRQQKNSSLVKAFKGVDKIAPPMELLAQLSQALPKNNGQKKYDIRQLSFKEDQLNIHGVTPNAGVIPEIEKSLKTFATDKKIKKIKSILLKESGKTPFSFGLKVNRKK